MIYSRGNLTVLVWVPNGVLRTSVIPLVSIDFFFLYLYYPVSLFTCVYIDDVMHTLVYI